MSRILVDFNCHGMTLKLKFRDGTEKEIVGNEKSLKDEWIKATAIDSDVKAELVKCNFKLPDRFRGEEHICPLCGSKLVEFGFKQNQQIWHNGLGTLTTKL